MTQLTRDYKGPDRRPPRSGGMKEFGLGVLAGALLAGGFAALIATHARHRPQHTAPSACSTAGPAAKASGHVSAATASVTPAQTAQAAVSATQVPAAGSSSASPAPQYDFYQMLPKLTVPVPGQTSAAHTRRPARPAGPPRYLVQVGSYTNAAQAQRLRKRLARMGIGARIERVTEHGMALNRVQVGPVDAAGLRNVRRQLAAAGIRPLVIPTRGK